MVFEIDLEASVLIAPRESSSFFIAAETEEEAIRIAKDKMKEKIVAKYEWADYENSDLITCYISYMKCIANFENERN